MRPVQVLLSTYNGERYLPALLDSLYAQTYSPVSILARDDGSRDATRDVLERYAGARGLQWYHGRHLGIRRSFFDLLTRADDAARAVAYCDQDDVWMPEKLARACARLDAEDDSRPLLYCSRARLVDKDLRPIGHTTLARRGPSLRNALVENIAPGCTMVLNQAARRMLLQRQPTGIGLHDSWTYLVISAIGQVLYDETPAVLYRQHPGNAVGIRHRRWQRRLSRLLAFNKNRELRRRFVVRAQEFEQLFGAQLDRDSRDIVARFIQRRRTLARSVAYAFSADVYRQTRADSMILRTLLAFRQI